MYLPDPGRVAPGGAGLDGVKETEITAGRGIRLVAWHAQAKRENPTVLYFHGQAANAANAAPKIQTTPQSGSGGFLPQNRRSGRCPDRAPARARTASAVTAMR